ncbi:MAG: endonuclease/exonuclease/phosphatase family protein [Planctomycetaceae bacterium]
MTRVLLLLLTCWSPTAIVAQDVGYTEAVDTGRLIGASLKSIRSSARWAFGRTKFEVTFRRARKSGHGYTGDDRELAKKLTKSDIFPPAQISGRWSLSENDSRLSLTDLKCNGESLPNIWFPIAGAGPFRANIGPMQFNIDEFGGTYHGSYVSKRSGARLAISSPPTKLHNAPATMTLVPAANVFFLKGPLVSRLTKEPLVRTLTWQWGFHKRNQFRFSKIAVNGEAGGPKGMIVKLSSGEGPNSIVLEGETFVREPLPKLPTRLVTYNVWYGFTKQPGRKKRWLRWMEDQTPDVVVLQELNKYTAKQLADDAEQWGHEHSVLLKEGGFPTGITSQSPITDVRKFRDGFHHGLMRVQTAGCYVYVVHLHPSNWEVRIREAKLLIEDANGLPKDARVIIAGDFNTFSPLDAEHYQTLPDLEPFFGRLDERSKGRSKNLRDGKLDYTPLRLLTEAGFVDQEARFRTEFKGTFPTRIEKEGEHGDSRRLDYILTNRNLSKDVLSTWSVSNVTTYTLSDHYPVIMDLSSTKR